MFLCLMLPFPFPLPQIPSNVDQKSAEPRREYRESMRRLEKSIQGRRREIVTEDCA